MILREILSIIVVVQFLTEVQTNSPRYNRPDNRRCPQCDHESCPECDDQSCPDGDDGLCPDYEDEACDNCEPERRCETVKKPDRGYVTCNDANTRCSFTCDTEYKLDGEEKITCQDGKWSGKEPKCTRRCETAKKPDRGYVTCNDANTRCSFTCESEYNIYGEARITCQDGNWSGKEPACTECKIPDDPDHGKVYCNRGKYVCVLICESDYMVFGTRTIVCRDGKWNNRAPTCRII